MHRRAYLAALCALCGGGLRAQPRRQRSRAARPRRRGQAGTCEEIDVARASTDPDELGRALARPYTGELAALGPHGVAITTRTTVTENGAQVSELSDTATLEVGGGSDTAWHGVYTNTADYGRETTWTGGSAKHLCLRPRYQRWMHERAPETPDERRWRGCATATARRSTATWELLAPGTELDRTPAPRRWRVAAVARW